MNTQAVAPTTNLDRAVFALLVTLFAFGALSGCTNQEEKARKALEQAAQECRNANTDDAFVGVDVGDEEDEQILQRGCKEELEGFEMTSDVSAKAETGPITWEARIDKETGSWRIYAADWSSLDSARRALEDDDLGEEEREYAELHFAKAQEQMPESAWIRLNRLENLLDLRAETRQKRKGKPYDIGEDATKHLEETVEWAEENDDPDTAAQAYYLAVDYIEQFRDFARDMRESADSEPSYERLEIAAEEAEEEGNDEEAEEYLAEIEKSEERRKENKSIYGDFAKKAEAAMCEWIEKISLEDVEGEQVQNDVTEIRNAVECDGVKPLAELEQEDEEDGEEEEGDQE